MKIILLSLLSLLLYGSECLNTHELNKIQRTIELFNEQYEDIPNYMTMFKLLSVTNIYAYENATKLEVNHHNYNNKHLFFDLSKYIKDKKIKYNQLCFDLKEKTNDLLGGLLPYPEIKSKKTR